ncbi:NADH-quinone oxidoreductase subunit J [Wolbachia endosymbiont of Pentidionis agamae]|uniref:NADH-quinone oxidoreductase subunit J n=1 Tax=Wolbachia endosymbiont of Pentidionis agamae TaxID=3110435 RepID=UPI002FD30143
MLFSLAFYFFTTLIIMSAVSVISAKNPVHSVLFLIFTFINSAILFIMIQVEFIAMMILIVYIGAVAVLFLFVVMMLDMRFNQSSIKYIAVSVILSLVFLLTILFVVQNSKPIETGNVHENLHNIRAIGSILYTHYMYAFHLAGILLLVAIVCAITLTLRDKKEGVKKQKLVEQLMQSSNVKLIKAKPREGIEWK